MNSWSLKKKIWAILLLVTLAFVATTCLSIYKLISLKDDLNEVSSVMRKRDSFINIIKDTQRKIDLYSMEIILQSDSEKIKSLEEEQLSLIDEQEDNFFDFKKIASSDGLEIFSNYEALYRENLIVIQNSRELALKNIDDKATEVLLANKDKNDRMNEYIEELKELTVKKVAIKSNEANQSAQNAIWQSLLIATLSIVSSVVIAFFVFKNFLKSIEQVIDNLTTSSAEVSTTSSKVSSSAEALSNASVEQAASLQQTSASLTQISTMVSMNSENAKDAFNISHKSEEKVEIGKKVVEKMISSMSEIDESNLNIKNQIDSNNSAFRSIVDMIKEIGNKTNVINEIVFQTKLLSFNASVEAARAGEHGKGFSVVAEEVGNLAHMSGQAAAGITQLLESSIKKVETTVAESSEQIVSIMREGNKKVEIGIQVAQECGSVLEEIVVNVKDVTRLVDEISHASVEQSNGINEITRAVAQLDQVTQSNASIGQESANAAQELTVQTQSLQSSVELLIFSIKGR